MIMLKATIKFILFLIVITLCGCSRYYVNNNGRTWSQDLAICKQYARSKVPPSMYGSYTVPGPYGFPQRQRIEMHYDEQPIIEECLSRLGWYEVDKETWERRGGIRSVH